jgi:hypothetical protein
LLLDLGDDGVEDGVLDAVVGDDAGALAHLVLGVDASILALAIST